MNTMDVYRSLAEALNYHHRTDQIKELAALICAEVPSKKPDRIEMIVSTLFRDPMAIFSRLSSLAQHAVEETVHSWGGDYKHRMFYAKYSSSPWLHRTTGNRPLENQGDLLGLFIVGGIIPDDLLKLLRNLVPHPPALQINYLESGPGKDCTIRETSQAALANAALVLQLVTEKKIRVGANTGRPTAGTCKLIGELLHQGDWYDDEEIGSIQCFSWPILLQGGGLAKAGGTILELTPAGVKAGKKDMAGEIRAIWNKWQKNSILDEFSRVTAIKGQKSRSGRTMSSPAKRRPIINALLKEILPGKWIAVDELSRLAQSREDFVFPMINYDWKLYIADPQYGLIDYNDTWHLLQLRYLLVYLFEYCATLGLIDVAYIHPHRARDDFRSCWGTDDLDYLSHCDGLQYIRINELGAYVLGHSKTFEATSDSTVSFVLDACDILFTGRGDVPPVTAHYYDKIATRREKGRWRISASTLLSAIKNGESLAGIRTALTSASSTPINTKLEQLFEEIGHRATSFVEVGRPPLIECNPELRKQIMTNKTVNRLCMPAGDRYLVVYPGKEKLFVSALATLGFSISLENQPS